MQLITDKSTPSPQQVQVGRGAETPKMRMQPDRSALHVQCTGLTCHTTMRSQSLSYVFTHWKNGSTSIKQIFPPPKVSKSFCAVLQEQFSSVGVNLYSHMKPRIKVKAVAVTCTPPPETFRLPTRPTGLPSAKESQRNHKSVEQFELNLLTTTFLVQYLTSFITSSCKVQHDLGNADTAVHDFCEQNRHSSIPVQLK